MDELLYCYLININCSIHHAIQKKVLIDLVFKIHPYKRKKICLCIILQHYEDSPVSLYVGVPNSVNIIASFTGLTLAWLTSDVVNSTGPCPGDIDSKVRNLCKESSINQKSDKRNKMNLQLYKKKENMYSN